MSVYLPSQVNVAQVGRLILDYWMAAQAENSERMRLEAELEAELHRCQSIRECFREAMDAVFGERQHLFDQYFDRFDRAVESGNTDLAIECLRCSLDLARTSPLEQLRDAQTFRRSLNDPNASWNL